MEMEFALRANEGASLCWQFAFHAMMLRDAAGELSSAHDVEVVDKVIEGSFA